MRKHDPILLELPLRQFILLRKTAILDIKVFERESERISFFKEILSEGVSVLPARATAGIW